MREQYQSAPSLPDAITQHSPSLALTDRRRRARRAQPLTPDPHPPALSFKESLKELSGQLSCQIPLLYTNADFYCCTERQSSKHMDKIKDIFKTLLLMFQNLTEIIKELIGNYLLICFMLLQYMNERFFLLCQIRM